jgi:hypothetical protein
VTVTRIPPVSDADRTRDPVLLAPNADTVADPGGHVTHPHWIVEGVQVKPQYGKPGIVTVWSPCCGRPRQRLGHGYAFSCPACGWWWRYHYVPATDSTRAVSIGRTRP